MDHVITAAGPAIFSGALLMVLGGCAKYLRDISRDLRELKTSVPVLYERVANIDARVISLEQHRKAR